MVEEGAHGLATGRAGVSRRAAQRSLRVLRAFWWLALGYNEGMSIGAPKKPPKAPPLADLAAELHAAGGRQPLLVGLGQFCPWSGWERVGVLALAEAGPPVPLWEGFLPKAGLDELRTRLAASGVAFPGELDFMYATAWRYAWTVPPAPCWLVDGEGTVVRTLASDVLVRTTDGRKVAIARSAIARVHADLSDDWALRTVAFECDGGERLEVAREEDPFVYFDPTYDGINLFCDTAWAVQLARALATALALPINLHPDLR